MVKLDNANIGDKLLVTTSLGRHIEIVTKILKLHVITDKNNKFRKCDGSLVNGNYFSYTFASITTDEEIAELKEKIRLKQERNGLIIKCSKIDFKKLPTDKLKKIIEIANA